MTYASNTGRARRKRSWSIRAMTTKVPLHTRASRGSRLMSQHHITLTYLNFIISLTSNKPFGSVTMSFQDFELIFNVTFFSLAKILNVAKSGHLTLSKRCKNEPAALLPTKKCLKKRRMQLTTVSYQTMEMKLPFFGWQLLPKNGDDKTVEEKSFSNIASVFRCGLFHMFWKEWCLFVAWNPEAQVTLRKIMAGSGHVSCTTYHIYGYVYIPNVDFLILKSSVHFPTITASNLSGSSPKSMTIMTALDDNALHQMMLSLCNLQSPDHPVVSLYVFNVVLLVKKRLEAFCPLKILWSFWDVTFLQSLDHLSANS